jgi:hypothetical protein
MKPVPKELFVKGSDFFVKIFSVWEENNFVHFFGRDFRDVYGAWFTDLFVFLLLN